MPRGRTHRPYAPEERAEGVRPRREGGRTPRALAVGLGCADAALTEASRRIRAASRRARGSPRVRAELRQAHNLPCGRERVARRMRSAGSAGISRRATRTTRRDAAPGQLWVAGIAHPPSVCASPACGPIDRSRRRSHAEARMAAFDSIDGSRPRRRHPALPYLSPADSERRRHPPAAPSRRTIHQTGAASLLTSASQ